MRLIAVFQDPAYEMPTVAVAVCAVAVTALVVGALRLPRAATPVCDGRTVPAPVVVGGVAGAGTLAYLGLLDPLFGRGAQPGWSGTPAQAAAVVVAPLLALAVGWALRGWARRSWARRSGWSDAHHSALVGGALVAHTVAGLVVFAPTTLAPHAIVDLPALAVSGALELAAAVVTKTRCAAP